MTIDRGTFRFNVLFRKSYTIFSLQTLERIDFFYLTFYWISKMSLVQRQGVHQLISMEKKALERINEAKKRRLIRLKQAREEALAEINAFKGVTHCRE